MKCSSNEKNLSVSVKYRNAILQGFIKGNREDYALCRLGKEGVEDK